MLGAGRNQPSELLCGGNTCGYLKPSAMLTVVSVIHSKALALGPMKRPSPDRVIISQRYIVRMERSNGC